MNYLIWKSRIEGGYIKLGIIIIVLLVMLLGIGTFLIKGNDGPQKNIIDGTLTNVENVDITFSPEVSDSADGLEFLGVISGGVIKVVLEANLIQISTNGQDYYTGTVNADTKILKGTNQVSFRSIKEGDYVSLFSIEGQSVTEGNFNVGIIRIMDDFEQENASLPLELRF